MVSGNQAEDLKARLVAIAARLPEVSRRPGGERGRHLAFIVGKKTFAYFTDDHHGDGRLALICRAPGGDQAALVSADPSRFFVPLTSAIGAGLGCGSTLASWTGLRWRS